MLIYIYFLYVYYNMTSFIENNKEKFCSLIFSIIYLVKSLRNTNIKNIEYTKQVDYLDKQFVNKIYSNNEIIYVKNLDEKIQKKYTSNQKWIITQFYDYEGKYMYEIEPYFENRVLTNTTKILITPDKIVNSTMEEKNVEDINTFREKYENSFLLYVIYFCFFNCVTTISKTNAKIINVFLNEPILFNKLMKKIVNMNKNYFTDLNFEMNNVLPSINKIIINIQLNILKIFNIQSDELICDLTKSKELQQTVMSNVMNFTTNYKLQFVKKENYDFTKINTDLSLFYEAYNKLIIPEIPANIKINYKTPYVNNKNISISESKDIDFFNIFYKTFNLNSDAMLSVLKYNCNASTNSLINYNKSKLELKSGLTQQERNDMKINTTTNLKELAVSSGGKKSKHNKSKHKKSKHKFSKKIYKGGVVAVSALGATGGYILATELSAAASAGYAMVGTGVSYLGGVPVVLVALKAAGAASMGPVAGVALVLVGSYGLYDSYRREDAKLLAAEAENIASEMGGINTEAQDNSFDFSQIKEAEPQKIGEQDRIQQGEQDRLQQGEQDRIQQGEQDRIQQGEQDRIQQGEQDRIEGQQKLDVKRLADEFNWNNPPYSSTSQPTLGISENPEWNYLNPPYSSTSQPALGTSENPEWNYLNPPYYTMYQTPAGMPQLNTNNDFNMYNGFLPPGEQITMPQQDFSVFNTCTTVGALGLVGVYLLKKFIKPSAPEPAPAAPAASLFPPAPAGPAAPVAPAAPVPALAAIRRPNVNIYGNRDAQAQAQAANVAAVRNANVNVYGNRVAHQAQRVGLGGKTRKRTKKYTKKRKYKK